MNKILQFTLDGRDIDVLYQNGNIAYTFEFEGKQYGNKVELASKSIIDVTSATFLLFTNALETMAALKQGAHDNTRV